jgi:hypothetical protein
MHENKLIIVATTVMVIGIVFGVIYDFNVNVPKIRNSWEKQYNEPRL